MSGLALRPSQLVDLRTSMVQWYRSDLAKHHESHDDPLLEQMKANPGVTVAERLEETLRAARLILVDSETTQLCMAAGESLPAGKLQWEEFPSISGMVVWNGEPIQRHKSERTGEMQDVVAMVWQVTFGRVGSVDAEIEPVGVYLKPYEDRDGGTMPEGTDEAKGREIARSMYRRLVPLSGSWVPFGSVAAQHGDWQHDMWSSPATRVLIATLKLMGQTIIDVEHQTDRRSARRAGRAGITDSGVSVVRLCRKYQQHGDAEPHTVGWKARWLVSGHWRQQWYPSAEEHRPIWVAPYVKGPEDLPIRVKDRVHLFDRHPS